MAIEPSDAQVVADILDGVVDFVESQPAETWQDPDVARVADRLVAALASARGYEA
jgi:hypothetical protein